MDTVSGPLADANALPSAAAAAASPVATATGSGVQTSVPPPNFPPAGKGFAFSPMPTSVLVPVQDGVTSALAKRVTVAEEAERFWMKKSEALEAELYAYRSGKAPVPPQGGKGAPPAAHAAKPPTSAAPKNAVKNGSAQPKQAAAKPVPMTTAPTAKSPSSKESTPTPASKLTSATLLESVSETEVCQPRSLPTITLPAFEALTSELMKTAAANAEIVKILSQMTAKEQSMKSPPPSASVPSSSMSAPVGPPPSPTVSSVKAWLKTRKAPLATNDAANLAWAKETGRPFNQKSGSSNPHAKSAFMRSSAFHEALLSETQALTDPSKMSVLSYNGFVRERREYFKGCPDNLDFKITFGTHGIMAGDSVRGRAACEHLVPGTKYDLVWIADSYADSKGPITPQRIKELTAYSRTGKVFGLWRPFIGEAGADDFGGAPAEGAWLRVYNSLDSGGRILFSPDGVNQPYPPHPDCNWMYDGHVDGLDITVARVFGPYCLVVMAVGVPGAYPVAANVRPQPSVVKVDYEGFSRWSPLLPSSWFSMGKRWLLTGRTSAEGYYCPALAENAQLSATQLVTGNVINTALQQVTTAFRNTPSMRTIDARFPQAEFRSKVVHGTAFQSIFGRRADLAETLYDARIASAPSDVYLTAARNPKPIQVTEVAAIGLRGGLAIGAVVGAVALFLKLLRTAKIRHASVYDADSPFILAGVVPVAEEVIRYILGRFSPALGFYEYAARHYKEGFQTKNVVPLVMVHLINDVLQATLGKRFPVPIFAFCIFRHMVYNALVIHHTEAPAALPRAGLVWATLLIVVSAACSWWLHKKERRGPPSAFAAFLLNRAQSAGPTEASTSVTEAIPMVSIPAVPTMLTELPANIRGSPTIKIDGAEMSFSEAMACLPVEYGNNCLWPLIVTNGLLYQPQNGPREYLVGLAHRVFNDPFVSCPQRAIRHSNWLWVAQIAVSEGLFAATVTASGEWTIQEAAAAMPGARGRRILQAYDDSQYKMSSAPKKSFFVKSNETIKIGWVDTSCGPVWAIKPRIITNLSPDTLASTLPTARNYYDMVHVLFDGTPKTFRGVVARLHFASGYNQERLDALADDMCSGDVCYGVGGDDSLLALGPLMGTALGDRPFSEGDFSMFDQSEDDGPMEAAAGYIMNHLGLDPFAISVLIAAKKAPVKTFKMFGRLEVAVEGEPGCQQATGSADTTVSNSVTNLLFFLFALARSLSLEDAARELGLTLKAKHLSAFSEVTFLKGHWTRDVDCAPMWIPLPSQVLKIGKTLTHPDVLLRKAGVRGEAALHTAASAIALSFGALDYNYPILGPFVEKMASFKAARGDCSAFVNEFENPFRVVPKGRAVDRDYAAAQICYRYNIAISDILRVERRIREVVTLPSFITDPVFDALREVDYC